MLLLFLLSLIPSQIRMRSQFYCQYILFVIAFCKNKCPDVRPTNNIRATAVGPTSVFTVQSLAVAVRTGLDLTSAASQTISKWFNNIWLEITILFRLFIHSLMHLADTFIQSDLQCIQAIHFSVCVFPGNLTHNICAVNAMLYHWATGTLMLSKHLHVTARGCR